MDVARLICGANIGHKNYFFLCSSNIDCFIHNISVSIIGGPNDLKFNGSFFQMEVTSPFHDI